MKDKQEILKQSHRKVETTLEALPEILEWCEQFVDGVVQKKFVVLFQWILAESFSEVVRNIHKNLPSTTPIEVELKLFTDYLEIQILEQGKPFYLLAYLMAGLPYENDYCADICVIPHLIDELRYITLPDKGNCLIMRKRLDLLQ